MGDFAAAWLALREPEDAGARSIRLTLAVADRLDGRTLRAVDLAGGTGANIRFLADYLAAEQRWLLVDADAGLLELVPDRMRAWTPADGRAIDVAAGSAPGDVMVHRPQGPLHLTTRRLDLASAAELAQAVAGADLVTASAFLDLVSGAWLEALAGGCTSRRAVALFALTYDGRIELAPAHPADEMIRALVNRHQRTDKGFGAALGPGACDAVAACFAAAGYEVQRAASDWRLGPSERALQRALVDGWAAAAADLAADRRAVIAAWRAWRLEQIEQGRSRIVVGHEDVAAWPRSR